MTTRAHQVRRDPPSNLTSKVGGFPPHLFMVELTGKRRTIYLNRLMHASWQASLARLRAKQLAENLEKTSDDPEG